MSSAIDLLPVEEIIRATDSGMTRPYICRLGNDLLYAVKGQRAQSRGLLAEVYAAVLGHSLGLPIPDFVLADIPRSLIEHSTDPEIRGLGAGLAFGSHWQDQITPISRLALHKIDPELLARIYLFDHWIANGDRSLTDHGGNPNLFLRAADDTLLVIDHNLAFAPDYAPAELQWHVCRDAWVMSGRRTIADNAIALTRARGAIDALPDILPYSWFEDEPDFHKQASATLDRYLQPEFWDQLG